MSDLNSDNKNEYQVTEAPVYDAEEYVVPAEEPQVAPAEPVEPPQEFVSAPTVQAEPPQEPAPPPAPLVRKPQGKVTASKVAALAADPRYEVTEKRSGAYRATRVDVERNPKMRNG
jgi:hypothetical protein